MGNPFILLMGDMNMEWPQDLWYDDLDDDGDDDLPREWRPRHDTERHAALMGAARELRLEQPRWMGTEVEKCDQWTNKGRSGNTNHVDLQLASKKVDRGPIGE